ncbi:MAG TPA: CBS domain-containing protein [Streptosporangiaceae bacterium]
MLRHLGAAYYESLHGRASTADVARALDSLEEQTGDRDRPRPATGPGRGSTAAKTPRDPEPARGARQHHGRWHHRVRDVMTTSVITVDRITPYKEIATLLAKHHISSVPVLILGRHVAGVVSEADLLAVEDKRERDARQHAEGGLHLHLTRQKHWGLTAEELMTSPAVTIHPDASLPAAARLMNGRHLKGLPVVDPDGTLAGVVSRCDLLSVFLRPDEDIAREVRDMLAQILLADPGAAVVRVHNGIVTLTGEAGLGGQGDLIPVAVRLVWDIDGVVDVVNKIGAASPS